MKYIIFLLAGLSIASVAIAADQEIPCREEVGEKQAAEYVSQCIQISPATHPPCNEQNSCSLIKDEIKRGCEFAKNSPGQAAPVFCTTK